MTDASRRTAAKEPAINATKLVDACQRRVQIVDVDGRSPNDQRELLIGELADVHCRAPV